RFRDRSPDHGHGGAHGYPGIHHRQHCRERCQRNFVLVTGCETERVRVASACVRVASMPTRQIATANQMPSWHDKPASAVLTELSATADGLTQVEAEARIAVHGPNRLPQP